MPWPRSEWVKAPIVDGNRVDVEMNGVPARMIVDTGAVASLLDQRFAVKAKTRGYGSSGHGISRHRRRKNQGGHDRAEEFQNCRDSRAIVLGHVAPLVFIRPAEGKIVGLLGIDFLGQNWGIIDFGQQKLYFARAKWFYSRK